MTVYQIFFSPAGTTQKTADTIGSALADALQAPLQKIDLLRTPGPELRCTQEDVVLFCLPVFAGRIPAVCASQLANIHGSGTPAITAVVYGNREYDDALLELFDLAQAQGFQVLGAAAVVAQHSIFPQVASGRPNAQDLSACTGFVQDCVQKLRHADTLSAKLPGSRPYRKPGSVPVKPRTDKNRCTSCKVCALLCPAQAIPADTPWQTDKQRCISCMACISACPAKARSLGGLLYKIGGAAFVKKCSTPRTPEFYL